MTPAQQKEIVSMLCRETEARLHKHIDAGNIPTAYDGFELRWMISDMFKQDSTRDDVRKRFRAYRRSVATIHYYHRVLSGV